MRFTPGEVQKAILKARKELGFKTPVRPRVRSVFYDEEEDFLLIILADRPDKSVALGPGGRVLKMVKDELGVSSMAARSYTDILVKRRRVGEALFKARRVAEKAEGLLKKALERVIALLRAELDYPPRRWPSYGPLDEPAIVVGFSGGIDSTAMLSVSKRLGLEPLAATIDAGGWMLPKEVRTWIKNVVGRLGIEHAYIKGDERIFGLVLKLARAGRRHPCRMCHEEIQRAVLRFALEAGTPMVGFGDLLPTGRYSIYWLKVGGRRLLRLNLMAALALFKTDTILMAREAGRPVKRLFFGCQLLKVVHREHREMMLPSIQRVLREARAGILEPNQALELVKSIIRS